MDDGRALPGIEPHQVLVARPERLVADVADEAGRLAHGLPQYFSMDRTFPRNHPGKRAYHHRVELSPRTAAEFLNGGSLGDRFAVWALACHGIESVANRYNPGSKRDLVPSQPVRIAAPVKALVTRAHEPGHGPQGRRRQQDPFSDQRVAAHEAPLDRVERPRLVEDRVWDGDLAHVVELRGAGHLIKAFRAHVQLAAHLECELTDVAQPQLQVGRRSDSVRSRTSRDW